MTTNSGGLSCSLGCWLLAAGVGFLTAVLLLVLGNTGWIGSVFLGGLAFVLLGLLFNWLFCAPLPKLGEVKPGDAYAARTSAQGSAGHGATTTAAAAPAAKPAPTASSAPAAKPAAPAAAAAPVASAAAASAAAASEPAVKPSAKLKGEEELSARKGDWKYDGDGQASKASAEKSASIDEDGIDRDGDGVVEGKNEGRRPEALTGPRGGTADDLKRIKGIGPKLEQLCFKLGFYHFDQIAAWESDEVAWVDANLEGFKGRVTRDEWVRQAKLLASGGETEFSKRVDDGDVY